MTGPEARVEEYLFREVRKRDGMCIKLIPVVAGIPDRLVLLPGGRLHLVELKSLTGHLRPAQKVWHQRAARRGIQVVVLNSKYAVDQWLQGLDTGVDGSE